VKITQVSYLKTFPLGQYINEKIEITIDLNEGDDVQSALSLARSECELNHKTNNPHLYQEQETIQHTYNLNVTAPQQEIIIEKISPEQEIEDTLKGIEEATAETLHTFRIKASQNIKTLGAYNRRKKQLNIQ